MANFSKINRPINNLKTGDTVPVFSRHKNGVREFVVGHFDDNFIDLCDDNFTLSHLRMAKPFRTNCDDNVILKDDDGEEFILFGNKPAFDSWYESLKQ